LKSLSSTKAILFTCSITWAFGKKSGSSFHFPPTSETGSAISWRKTKIIGENPNMRLETVAITGVQKSALFTRSIDRTPEAISGVLYFARKR
jgi:hypothetical protein